MSEIFASPLALAASQIDALQYAVGESIDEAVPDDNVVLLGKQDSVILPDLIHEPRAIFATAQLEYCPTAGIAFGDKKTIRTDLHRLRRGGRAIAAAVPFRFPKLLTGFQIVSGDVVIVDDHDLSHTAVGRQTGRAITDLAITAFPDNFAVRLVVGDKRYFRTARRAT